MASIKDSLADLDDELRYWNELNENNAPSKIDIASIDQFSYSLGSYDAIAELDKKVALSFGGNEFGYNDPTHYIT
jgi:hypothetical protein